MLTVLHHFLPAQPVAAADTAGARVVAGEACWWTIHPASKQRSEGEKVRIGDDLILVSLSSERYLVSFPLNGPRDTSPDLSSIRVLLIF